MTLTVCWCVIVDECALVVYSWSLPKDRYFLMLASSQTSIGGWMIDILYVHLIWQTNIRLILSVVVSMYFHSAIRFLAETRRVV